MPPDTATALHALSPVLATAGDCVKATVPGIAVSPAVGPVMMAVKVTTPLVADWFTDDTTRVDVASGAAATDAPNDKTPASMASTPAAANVRRRPPITTRTNGRRDADEPVAFI